MINSGKIKGRMVELGLTQEKVAKEIGIAQATLNQKINNVRPMDLEEAEKLSDILGLRPEEFCLYFFV